MAEERCRVIAVCGHEAAYGRASPELAGPDVTVVPSGRELFRCLAELSRRGTKSCVVPMTLGRDPGLVTDTARTMRAMPAAQRAGTVLAEPFGSAQHLVGWLRAAAGRVPASDALLVTAPSGDVFDDAELYRVASLAGRYGNHPLVEVAFTDGAPDPAEGVRRCVLLGAARVALLAASFVVPEAPEVQGAQVCPPGPLVPRTAVRRVLAERAAAAWQHRRERGDDGIAAAVSAAGEHGHRHSHDHDIDHGLDYGHEHPPQNLNPPPPPNPNPHSPVPGTEHSPRSTS